MTTENAYEAVADLPLAIEGYATGRQSRTGYGGFDRTTTTVTLRGEGATGKGEDVTYDADEHAALADWDGLDGALAGKWTFGEFSAHVGALDPFPGTPERQEYRHYRRWALESAGLDLALRQADTHLGAAIGASYDPVRFVASTRLDDPPTTDRVEALLEVAPDAEFKLDPRSDWTGGLIADLAALDRVRVVDLKGYYQGTGVEQPPDRELYERVISGFPEAIVEDPAVTEATRPVVERVRDRLAWDAPVTSVQALGDLPYPPTHLNVKPSRFGSVRSLLACVEHCRERGVVMYGGGQFELDVGRGQAQLLASLLYPSGPNDLAPTAYNDVDPDATLPASPLAPPADPAGFRW